MTGTALTEADEFLDIYNLEVLEVPTNMPMIRLDDDDEVYRTGAEKYRSVLALIRSEEHTSELQSPCNLVCRLLLEKKKRFIPRRSRTRLPEMPASTRRSPGRQVQNALLTQAIPAYPHSARKSLDRPVTAQVVGFNP